MKIAKIEGNKHLETSSSFDGEDKVFLISVRSLLVDRCHLLIRLEMAVFRSPDENT